MHAETNPSTLDLIASTAASPIEAGLAATLADQLRMATSGQDVSTTTTPVPKRGAVVRQPAIRVHDPVVGLTLFFRGPVVIWAERFGVFYTPKGVKVLDSNIDALCARTGLTYVDGEMTPERRKAFGWFERNFGETLGLARRFDPAAFRRQHGIVDPDANLVTSTEEAEEYAKRIENAFAYLDVETPNERFVDSLYHAIKGWRSIARRYAKDFGETEARDAAPSDYKARKNAKSEESRQVRQRSKSRKGGK